MDKRHGGPYDRGSADAWYGRDFDPHYYTGKTYMSERMGERQMTIQEKLAYTKGYNETPWGQKTWD
jgi:hypothetical protein